MAYEMAKEVEKRSSDIFLEFLEAAIHVVLHARQLYPETIFVKKKLYGTIVYCSIHPEINEYITENLKGIEELIKKNEVKKVCIVFYDKGEIPVDKIVFDILALYSQLIVEDNYFIHTEELLRAALLKISYSCRTLKLLCDESSFSIQIHTTETASLTLTDDPYKQEIHTWIEAEQRNVNIDDSRIIAIRDLKTDYLHIQMYAVESSESNSIETR